MPIVGAQILKVDGEKKNALFSGKVNIKNGLSFPKVEEVSSLNTKEHGGAAFHFKFVYDYEPEVAKMSVDGRVLYTGKKEEVKKLLEDWAKSSILPPEIMENVANLAMNRANIECVKLADVLDLPCPLPIPRFKAVAEEVKPTSKGK